MQQKQNKEIKMTYNTHHSKIIYVILIITLVLFLNPNIFSRIYQNGAGSSYDGDNGSGDSSSVTTLSSYNIIEHYAIRGAGFFLAANSDIQCLLKKIELSTIEGFNSDELLNITKRILFNMNNAEETYDLLIKIAEVTPYNEDMIAKLIMFDYDLFREKNDLIPDVFNEVAEYLKRGDVTGNYKKSYKEFGKIIGILLEIQAEIKLKGMPDISRLWKLNHVFQRTLLGGQYVAQVFYEISNNSSKG
jgi:hypothetical protein